MSNASDKEIQMMLVNIQHQILKYGALLVIVTFLYESVVGAIVKKSATLNISLISLIVAVTVLILVVLGYGLRADKTETRDTLLISSKEDYLQRWLSAQLFYVKYRDEMVKYIVGTIISFIGMILCFFLQNFIFFTILIIASTLFLSQVAGIAKEANKISIFSIKYRKELEKIILSNNLIEK